MSGLLDGALSKAIGMIDDPAKYTEVSPHYRRGWVDALTAVRDDPAIRALDALTAARAEPGLVSDPGVAVQLHEATDNAGLACDGDHSKGWGRCQLIAARLPEVGIPTTGKPTYVEVRTTACHAGSDGDCSWSDCPQLRDGEPVKSGRHCPLDAIAAAPWSPARPQVARAEPGLRAAVERLRDVVGFVADWAHDCSPTHDPDAWSTGMVGAGKGPTDRYGFDAIEERCHTALEAHGEPQEGKR